MLVLSRAQRQSIVLRYRGLTLATITVTGVRAGKVSLGIEAARLVRVLREELLPVPIAPEPLAAFAPQPCDDPQLLAAGS